MLAWGEVGAGGWGPVPLEALAAVAGTLVGRAWGRRAHERLDLITVLLLGVMGVWSIARAVLGALLS